MTKEELSKALPHPFGQIVLGGGSIDYRCSGCKDHEFIGKLGYECHMNGDCSMTSSDLPAISFSSYGDWGTFFELWAEGNDRQVFHDMYREGIIKLWRGSFSIGGKSYIYVEGDGYQYYDDELKSWLYVAESPFKK